MTRKDTEELLALTKDLALKIEENTKNVSRLENRISKYTFGFRVFLFTGSIAAAIVIFLGRVKSFFFQ